MIIKLEDLGEGVKGFINVKLPTNGQRQRMMDDYSIDMVELAEKFKSDETEGVRYTQKFLGLMLDDLGPFCDKISIDFEGSKIDSYDEINYNPKLVGIQYKIATTVLLGSNQFIDKKKKKSAKR